MKPPLVGAALVAALGLTAACSSPSPARQPTQVARTAPAPRPAQPQPRPVTSTGRSAIAQHDTPYTQVLAQARSSGRPTVLYFWTSW